MDRPLPLADIRVIAIEQYGAGPFGSVHLAELGADVIKIEDPRVGGDIGRRVPPELGDGNSLFFETFNHNKRSLALDLSVPAGRLVLERLVSRSDAVFSNVRGDVPQKLGIRYADLASINPRIVCCSLSGYGMASSLAREPAYDYILQGLSGWMSLTGEPGTPPMKSGLSLVDFASGYAAAMSILAGVHAARRDGLGMDCDLALYDVAMNLLTYVATWQLTLGFTTERTVSSAHPTLVPFQNFATSDGWIVVACAKEKFWTRLVDALGVSHLGVDPRFCDFAARDRNRSVLIPMLERIFRTDTLRAWLTKLRRAGVPVGPVHDLPTAVSDAFVHERELVAEYKHDRFGTVKVLRSAIDVGRLHTPITPAPRMGADSWRVLREIAGLSDADIESLVRSGVVTTDSNGAGASDWETAEQP